MPLLSSRSIGHPFTRAEFDYAFTRVRSRRSPGLDGLTGEMCKSIWKVIPDSLMAIYERCQKEGYFPTEWKVARVIVLLKSPDKVRSNPRSYRGISLLPVLGKVLERVMVERLQERLCSTASRRQFGFKPGLSCEDAWRYVVESVKCSRSKYVLGVFVDFKGAFDNLCWSSVINRLEEVGCEEIALWRSYFSSRSAVVVGVGGSERTEVVRGCPQGSIAGPYIWNMMMDILLGELEPICKCCAYADDLLLLVESDARHGLETRGVEIMRIVERWGDSVGVRIASEKTVAMLLRGRLSASRPPVLRMTGWNIRYDTQVKYLGIHMSERMCFMPHLAELRRKLTGTVGMMKRVLTQEWGLSRRAARIIYGGLYVACATYGASVWCGVLEGATARKKLLSCQRVMMLGCLNVCRTVSTDSMQVLLGAPPLDLDVMRKAIAFGIRRRLPLVGGWVGDEVYSLNVKERTELLNECVLSRWQERWEGSDKGRVTFEYIRDVRYALGKAGFSFNLELGFLLTGHGSLNAYLNERGLSECAECLCGASREDWKHVLCECPLYSDVRNKERMGISVNGEDHDVSEALSSVDNIRWLNDFAKSAFDRRRSLVSGLNRPG